LSYNYGTSVPGSDDALQINYSETVPPNFNHTVSQKNALTLNGM